MPFPNVIEGSMLSLFKLDDKEVRASGEMAKEPERKTIYDLGPKLPVVTYCQSSKAK
jgi:hypothetical protein